MRLPLMTAAAVSAVLLLGACSAGKDSDAAPNPADPAAPASSSAGSSQGGNPVPTAAASSAMQPTPADPSRSMNTELGQPVASRTSSNDGIPVTITMYPVIRSGTTSSVNFTLSSPGKDDKDLQVADILSDGDWQTSDASGHAADGLALVDGKNSKLYLVASDGKGTCLCSRQLGVLAQPRTAMTRRR